MVDVWQINGTHNTCIWPNMLIIYCQSLIFCRQMTFPQGNKYYTLPSLYENVLLINYKTMHPQAECAHV